MAEIIARPTQLLFYNNANAKTFAQGLIDGDPSGQSTSISGNTISAMNIILGGFDFSALPLNAIITDLRVTYVMEESKGGGIKTNCLKDATGVSTYTDLGDGEITVALSVYPMDKADPKTVSFPNAASAVTADFLKNDGLQVRVYRGTSSSYCYCYSLDLYATVTYTEACRVECFASPAEGGSVSGTGNYLQGTDATLTATPNAGYLFKQWSDGNTSASRTVTVTANATYTAIFEKEVTSKVFAGTSRQTSFSGTMKQTVYKGTTKIS